jgi:hypothetical protein
MASSGPKFALIGKCRLSESRHFVRPQQSGRSRPIPDIDGNTQSLN